MRPIQTALLAAALAGALAAPAFALVSADVPEVRTEQLQLKHVDFRDSAQVQATFRRLQQASLFVCGYDADADRAQREAARACSERALQKSVASIDRPLLTATYQQAGAPMLARGY